MVVQMVLDRYSESQELVFPWECKVPDTRHTQLEEVLSFVR